MSFFFFKNRDEEVKQVLSGSLYSGREKDIRKGYSRVNMVEILCIHL
jgi:hypothetical protein